MTKAVGLALILLAALLYAARRTRDIRQRYDALHSFCRMLEQMHGILEVQAPPMPELLNALSGRCTGPASRFAAQLSASMDSLGAESFSVLWKQALSEVRELDRDALLELEALGGILGRYDLKTQLDAVNACFCSLRQQRETVQKALPQAKRLTYGISLCAALLLGIILI